MEVSLYYPLMSHHVRITNTCILIAGSHYLFLIRVRHRDTSYRRDLIKEQLVAGTSVAKIKKQLHCSTQFIADVRRTSANMPPVKRGGGIRILSDSDVENMKILCQRKQLLTRNDCVKHCKDVYGKVVSK